MRDTRSHTAIRIDALQRLLMLYLLSDRIPLFLVTEYPKSGGSWVAQMLAAYMGIPFIRNRRPPLMQMSPCVLHGHYLYNRRFRNTVVVIRDGRDVMVSAYYHMLHHNDKNPPWSVERNRRKLPFADYEDIVGNLPRFIEYMFTDATKGLFHFSWAEFIYSWQNAAVPILRYEKLLSNAVDSLSSAIRYLTGDEPNLLRLDEIARRYSFENLAKRKPGEEDSSSFLRKGIAGDWKNHFSREACEVFDHYAGDLLIELKYEDDRSWIRDWVVFK